MTIRAQLREAGAILLTAVVTLPSLLLLAFVIRFNALPQFFPL